MATHKHPSKKSSSNFFAIFATLTVLAMVVTPVAAAMFLFPAFILPLSIALFTITAASLIGFAMSKIAAAIRGNGKPSPKDQTKEATAVSIDDVPNTFSRVCTVLGNSVKSVLINDNFATANLTPFQAEAQRFQDRNQSVFINDNRSGVNLTPRQAAEKHAQEESTSTPSLSVRI